jgi:chitinase
MTIGKPPTATINHPSDMEKRSSKLPILFIGAGIDPEDGTLTGASMVWTSDKTMMIGTGTQFEAPLPQGTHLITLTATDSDKNTATDSITLYVE